MFVNLYHLQVQSYRAIYQMECLLVLRRGFLSCSLEILLQLVWIKLSVAKKCFESCHLALCVCACVFPLYNESIFSEFFLVLPRFGAVASGSFTSIRPKTENPWLTHGLWWKVSTEGWWLRSQTISAAGDKMAFINLLLSLGIKDKSHLLAERHLKGSEWKVQCKKKSLVFSFTCCFD